MFSLCERADETLKDITESIPRFGWVQRGWRRLFADNQLDLRYHLRQHPSVRAQRTRQAGAPQRQSVFALGEKLPDQAAECLRECAVWDVPDDLIELSGDEVPPLPDDRLVQLVNERCLADSGVARHEHQPGASLARFVEGAEQIRDFTVPAVEFLRNEESVRHVLLRQIEGGDRPLRGPLGKAPVNVLFEAKRTLIAILRGFGQQLSDDPGQLLRDRFVNLRNRRREPGNVSVDQLEGIARDKGRRSGQELV